MKIYLQLIYKISTISNPKILKKVSLSLNKSTDVAQLKFIIKLIFEKVLKLRL